jgi:hypothetical protein
MNILKQKKSKQNVTYKKVKFSAIGNKQAQVSYCYQIVINKKNKRNKPTEENILRKHSKKKKLLLVSIWMMSHLW